MKQTSLIKLFISCPSDVIAELDSIKLIIQEINKTSGKKDGFIIDTLNWDLDTYPSIGSDAQEVINKQIEDEYDILIGVIGQRLGTPTKRDKSGTVEEINNTIADSSKSFLIYFNNSTPENMNEIDPEEVIRIRAFKKELSGKGVLYKEFSTISEFETKFRINLLNLIQNYLSENSHNPPTSKAYLKGKYAELEDFLNDVENQDETNLEIDIFNLVEENETYLNNITISMNSFTKIMEEFAERLTLRTEEITKFRHIRDERLKMSKTKTIFNLLAGELDDLTTRIRTELPIFAENFRNLSASYPKVQFAADQYQGDKVEELNSAVRLFKNTVEETTNQAADFIRQIMQWPPINSRFNKAKREVELVFKDLTKEMLMGLKVFNEIVGED